MTEISIRLSSFSDFTAVNVEGLGVIKVKKESSNQGARHSEIIRDIFRLQDQGKALQQKISALIAEGKGENDPEFLKLEKKGSEALEKISELRTEDQKLRKSRLSDDEGGKLVDILFDSASDQDIAKLLNIEPEAQDEQTS